MWVDLDQLQEAAEMALDDPYLLDLMKQQTEATTWEDQDMLLCKIMNYVKEKKESSNNN